MATGYDINYDDKRFTQVDRDKKEALSEVEKTYGGMISDTDKYYNAQIDASKEWADKQSQLQQEKSDFTVEQIEQQKAQAEKDYTKEQSGAYVDWQKETNRYGAKSEEIAAQGLSGTGYSESSKVSLYNTYQNRIATARESYQNAILNYNNAIKDARLQNNSALAQIAYEALQQQLELSLAGFQYKNQLLIDKTNKRFDVDNTYYGRYQDVLQQINTENALAEQIRQYNKNYELQKKEYEEGVRQFNEEMSRLRENDAREGAQWEAEMAEKKRQFDAENSRSTQSSAAAPTISRDSGTDGTSAVDKSSSSVSRSTGKSNTHGGGGGKFGSSADTVTPNMDSVLALGYGPLSASRLDSLVRSGKVIEYEKDGELYYRKA